MDIDGELWRSWGHEMLIRCAPTGRGCCPRRWKQGRSGSAIQGGRGECVSLAQAWRPGVPAPRPSPGPQVGLGAVTPSCGGSSRSDASRTGAAFPRLPALPLERAANTGGHSSKKGATKNATLSDEEGSSVFANGSSDAAHSPSTSMHAGLRRRRRGALGTRRKASAWMAWFPDIDGHAPRSVPFAWMGDVQRPVCSKEPAIRRSSTPG